MRLLESGKTATQREIYYAFVKHFANQVTKARKSATIPLLEDRSATQRFLSEKKDSLPVGGKTHCL